MVDVVILNVVGASCDALVHAVGVIFFVANVIATIAQRVKVGDDIIEFVLGMGKRSYAFVISVSAATQTRRTVVSRPLVSTRTKFIPTIFHCLKL